MIHTCNIAKWLSLLLLFVPAAAHAAELAVPGTVPSVDSFASVSWPAAFVFGVYSLRGAKLPVVQVQVRVREERDTTAEAPRS